MHGAWLRMWIRFPRGWFLYSRQCAGNRHGHERGHNGSIVFEINVTFRIQYNLGLWKVLSEFTWTYNLKIWSILTKVHLFRNPSPRAFFNITIPKVQMHFITTHLLLIATSATLIAAQGGTPTSPNTSGDSNCVSQKYAPKPPSNL